MTSGVVEKVTAFIIRERAGERQLLLFEHPNAGVQIPAGTVEEGESPDVGIILNMTIPFGTTGYMTPDTKTPNCSRSIRII